MQTCVISPTNALYPTYPLGIRMDAVFVYSMASLFTSLRVTNPKFQALVASQSSTLFRDNCAKYSIRLETDARLAWWSGQPLHSKQKKFRLFCQRSFLLMLKSQAVVNALECLGEKQPILDPEHFPPCGPFMNAQLYSVWLHYIAQRYRAAKKDYTSNTFLMLDIIGA